MKTFRDLIATGLGRSRRTLSSDESSRGTPWLLLAQKILGPGGRDVLDDHLAEEASRRKVTGNSFLTWRLEGIVGQAEACRSKT